VKRDNEQVNKHTGQLVKTIINNMKLDGGTDRNMVGPNLY
jgi:hypothetical protein